MKSSKTGNFKENFRDLWFHLFCKIVENIVLGDRR